MSILPKFVRTAFSPLVVACLFIVFGWAGFVRPDCNFVCDPNIACWVAGDGKGGKVYQHAIDKKGNETACVRVYYTKIDPNSSVGNKKKRLQFEDCSQGNQLCPPVEQDPDGKIPGFAGTAEKCGMCGNKRALTCFCECKAP